MTRFYELRRCRNGTVIIDFSQSKPARFGEVYMRGGLLVALALSVCVTSTAQAQVLISGDRGGRIGTYVDKYHGLRMSGQNVIIDGLCASACTMVLGAIPSNRIFFTPRAVLGFHAAWDFGPRGRAVTNRDATNMLYSMYPPTVRRWIAARGGLTSKMLFLSGKSLARMGFQRYEPRQIYASATPRW